MSIQKQITLRYRSDGHLRFQLPDALCLKPIADIITAKVLEIEGVYRVSLFRGQKKISIRFNEAACDSASLVKQFSGLIDDLDRHYDLSSERPAEQPSKTQVVKQRVAETKWLKWIKTQYSDAKETVQAAKTLTKLGLKKPKALVKDPEKAIIDFFNDVLVLYLIRIHWTRITQEWIPHPWVHRYHWSAVFYLFYLLMRSRRPK